MVESGRISPCRAIDLGCGTASNCIYLAQRGFDVTGIDFSPTAIENGIAKAVVAGVKVNFVVDNLTNLRHVSGLFDLLVDYGTLDDLKPKDRELYVKNVLQLTHPGSQMLLFGFEYPLRWWERLIPLFRSQFEPGEVERLFGDYFEIKRIASGMYDSIFFPGYAIYLMKRKP